MRQVYRAPLTPRWPSSTLHTTCSLPSPGPAVLLEIGKVADVGVPAAVAWALVRDFPRLSGCIPCLSDFRVVDPDRRYTAVVSDKLGPFRLQVPIQIEVKSIVEPRQIVVELSGNDSRGQARVRGTLDASVDSADAGTQLALGMRLDVLGRLADELFGEFVRRLTAELAAIATGDDTVSRGAAG